MYWKGKTGSTASVPHTVATVSKPNWAKLQFLMVIPYILTLEVTVTRCLWCSFTKSPPSARIKTSHRPSLIGHDHSHRHHRQFSHKTVQGNPSGSQMNLLLTANSVSSPRDPRVLTVATGGSCLPADGRSSSLRTQLCSHPLHPPSHPSSLCVNSQRAHYSVCVAPQHWHTQTGRERD